VKNRVAFPRAHDPELRGLGLYETPCGILTYNKYRKRHNWVTIDKSSGERREWGEDYMGATGHGLTTVAWLVLELDKELVGPK